MIKAKAKKNGQKSESQEDREDEKKSTDQKVSASTKDPNLPNLRNRTSRIRKN